MRALFEIELPNIFDRWKFIEFSPDDRFLMIGRELSSRDPSEISTFVFDLETKQQVAAISGQEWGVVKGTFLDNDRVILGGARSSRPKEGHDSRIWIWSLSRGKAERIFGSTPHLTDFDLAQDKVTLAASYGFDLIDGEWGSFDSRDGVQIWNLETGELEMKIGAFPCGVDNLSFIENDKAIVLALPEFCWESADGRLERKPVYSCLRKLDPATGLVEECVGSRRRAFVRNRFSALKSGFWTAGNKIYKLNSPEYERALNGDILDLDLARGMALTATCGWAEELGENHSNLNFFLTDLETGKVISSFAEGDGGYQQEGGRIGRFSNRGGLFACHGWGAIKVYSN